jgi:hypothetical protein
LLQTRFIKNPYTLYNTLKNLYCAQGFSSRFILSKELINTIINTYKGNLELYINAFKRILNNLEAKGINLPSNFTAALLLNNLNKDYKYIITIITYSTSKPATLVSRLLFLGTVNTTYKLQYYLKTTLTYCTKKVKLILLFRPIF